jgi:hypothetical protein
MYLTDPSPHPLVNGKPEVDDPATQKSEQDQRCISYVVDHSVYRKPVITRYSEREWWQFGYLDVDLCEKDNLHYSRSPNTVVPTNAINRMVLFICSWTGVRPPHKLGNMLSPECLNPTCVLVSS